jgi:dihydrofolate reductase
MRKLIANFFLSLDGVMESPDKWHFPYFNDEMGAAIGTALGATDTLLMGRVNYEEWAAHWPSAEDEIADFFNNVPKFVVSTTLETAEWNNTTVIRGDVPAAITELKQQAGKDIAISGSATLVRSLLADDLIDELNLLVHPLVVGSGRRLFVDGSNQQPLSLVHSQTFSTGVVHLTYAPADKA